jgi:protoheme IX farnesyltransferase
MAYDSDIDAIMARTATRPIPMGRIAREEALTFGWWLSVASVTIMGLFINLLSAALLAFTIFFYVVVYTQWQKRRTAQNIVIGGLAGALPPAIGWAAVTGQVTLAPLVMVAIIFLWTPPHFWALALFRSDDYARAGVPMMPVVAGKPSTRRQIFAYTLLLLPFGLAPAALGFAGPLYLASAGLMSAWFLFGAVKVLFERDEVKEPAAKKLFFISIAYLFVLFAALIAERLIGVAPFGAWLCDGRRRHRSAQRARTAQAQHRACACPGWACCIVFSDDDRPPRRTRPRYAVRRGYFQCRMRM